MYGENSIDELNLPCQHRTLDNPLQHLTKLQDTSKTTVLAELKKWNIFVIYCKPSIYGFKVDPSDRDRIKPLEKQRD